MKIICVFLSLLFFGCVPAKDKISTPEQFIGRYGDNSLNVRYMYINDDNTIHYTLEKEKNDGSVEKDIFETSKFRVLKVIDFRDIIILEYDISHQKLGKQNPIIKRFVLYKKDSALKPIKLFYMSGLHVKDINNEDHIQDKLKLILERNNYYRDMNRSVWNDAVLSSMWSYYVDD